MGIGSPIVLGTGLGIVAGISSLAAWWFCGELFCEDCKRWVGKYLSIYVPSGSTYDALSILYHQDFGRLKELVPRGVLSERNRLEINLDYCAGCEENGYVTVTSVLPTVKEDEDGEEKDSKEEKTLVTNAAISQVGLAILLEDFRDGVSSKSVFTKIRKGLQLRIGR